jgi:hypothetical protein
MRLSVGSPAISWNRGSRLKLLFALLILLTAYPAAQFILGGDLRSLAIGGLAIIVVMFVIAILNDFRRGVLIFLGWLTVEDLARKFLGNNMAIYFAKDFLVAVVYLSFFLAWRREKSAVFRPPFLVPLLLFVWLGIAQMFNPSSTSIVFSILGVKLFFYYVPLLFVGYSLIDSELRLRQFFVANSLAALFVAGLGVVQSIIGPSFLNPAHLQEDIRELSTLYRVAPISGVMVYRPNSVFVSTGRYGDYLLLQCLLVLGFTGYLLLRHRRGRALAFVATATVAGGVVLAASRGIFLWCMGSTLVVGAAFLWGAPWRQREVKRVLRAIQRLLLGIGLGLILLLIAYPGAILGRFTVYSETLSPDSPASELMYRVKDYPMRNFMGAFSYPQWPYGYGIGTTALGIQYVTRIFQVRSPVQGAESGFGTLVVELGILGLILWIFMSAAILISGWSIVRKLRGSPWFPFGFVIWWYAFLLLLPITFMGIQPYEDFIMNAYLWLLLGILFRLPSIALSAQSAAGAASMDARQRMT